MGDSLMAVFGVPVAHDDDAERAVAAGLAMRRLGGDLVFSIGINSGAVMATPVGEGGDSTVIGDTVNVAARLEKAAGPGEVWCGPLTAELIGSRAVFRARQPVILKGKREPVEVWEAVALRPSDASQPGDAMPMLGREDDLAYLESLWRRVHRDGEAQVALLCGEAGSGKTRLVRELARRTQPEGSLIWATYPAYGPVGGPRVAAEVLRQLGSAGDEDVMARVRSLVGPAEQSLQAIDPAGLQQEQLWALAGSWRRRAPTVRCSSSSTTCTAAPRRRSTSSSASAPAWAGLRSCCCSSGGATRATGWAACHRPEPCAWHRLPPKTPPISPPPSSARSRSPRRPSTSWSNGRAATPCTCAN